MGGETETQRGEGILRSWWQKWRQIPLNSFKGVPHPGGKGVRKEMLRYLEEVTCGLESCGGVSLGTQLDTGHGGSSARGETSTSAE